MPAIPYAEFQDAVLKLYRSPFRARSTRYKMAEALTEFGLLACITSTDQITTERASDWVHARTGKNVNTTISLIRSLKTAVNYGVGEGWIARAPQWRRVMPRGAISASKRHHSHDQVVQLLASLKVDATTWKRRRLEAVVSVVAYTGLRRNEALRLQCVDIDLTAGLLNVVARHRLKTEASAAPVPIPPELATILEAWLPTALSEWAFPGTTRVGPWDSGAWGYRAADELREAGIAVGIPGVTFHSL